MSDNQATQADGNGMTTQAGPRTHLALVLLLIYALVVYAAMNLRFVGNWSENDTAVITRAIVSSGQADSIRNAEFPYSNGAGYIAIVMVLAEITGFSVQTLQLYIMPTIAALNVLVLFVGYRAVLRLPLVAMLAALFAYLQADFLWVTWRGSHEKITWMLVIGLVFLLARTFIMWNQTRIMARYTVLFYIVAFALISSNAFFASSFIVAIILSFVGGSVFFRLRQIAQREQAQPLMQHFGRLIYINVACIVLFYIFVFHLYPESISTLRGLRVLADQLALLFLNVEEQTVQTTTAATLSAPVNYLRVSWLSTNVFLSVTIFSWLLLGFSALVWLVGLVNFLRRRVLAQHNLPLLFLWLLYPAFAAQVGGALIADRVAVFGANLQVRLFTPVMLMAIPLSALGVYFIIRYIHRFARPVRLVLFGLASLAVFWFSIAALFKSTNEPLLNNFWVFNVTPEQAAGDWAVQHLADTLVWTGSQERVATGLQLRYVDVPNDEVSFHAYSFRAGTRYFLFSDLEMAMRRRAAMSLPSFIDEQIVYDNGNTQIYYRRPVTPYER
ncbi:MAG: hypothetical protein GYB67_03365 [Chloroflexi bacterium]|nr:hypothetical protein [Chloroflexota bacterium]